MASFDHDLFENTDMVMKIVNLRDDVTKALQTGATVTARVLDSAGVAVVGISDPVVFVEQASPKKGLYHGGIPDSASLVNADTGTIHWVADAGAGLHREWTETYAVKQA
jgi:hypothetical protein